MKAVILSARGPKRFLQLGGGKRKSCFLSLEEGARSMPGAPFLRIFSRKGGNDKPK